MDEVKLLGKVPLVLKVVYFEAAIGWDATYVSILASEMIHLDIQLGLNWREVRPDHIYGRKSVC